MSADVITTKYRDIDITYLENEALWIAKVGTDTIRSEKLSALKKRIDSILEPKTKDGKPFQRFGAYYAASSYGGIPEPAQVTSIDGTEVWVVTKDGRRKVRIGIGNLYEDTPENVAVIERLRELENQHKALRRHEEFERGKLQKLKWPREG